MLCSVPNPEAVLEEVGRVLRPGGKLLFVEHVGAKWGEAPALRTQQQLLEPLQRWLADGCHLTRDTGATFRRGIVPAPAGCWESLQLEQAIIPGIADLISPHVYGIATRGSV